MKPMCKMRITTRKGPGKNREIMMGPILITTNPAIPRTIKVSIGIIVSRIMRLGQGEKETTASSTKNISPIIPVLEIGIGKSQKSITFTETTNTTQTEKNQVAALTGTKLKVGTKRKMQNQIRQVIRELNIHLRNARWKRRRKIS